MWYLFWGYAIVFVLLLGFVVRLAGMLERLEDDVRRLSRLEDGGNVDEAS